MPYQTEVGTAVTIDIVFTVGGVPQLLVTAPTLWKAIAPDRSEFTPTSSTVNTAVIGYQYTLAGADTTTEGAGTYVLWFRTNDADVDGKGTDGYAYYYESVTVTAAVLGLIDDIKAKTDLISTGNVSVVAPVSSTGRVTIYQGKDYNSTDSTALEWTSTSTLALDTVGTTVSFDMVGEQFAGVITGSSGAWTIRVNLTAAQTAALPVGDSPYELTAVLASGRTPPPLAVGTVTVKAEV